MSNNLIETGENLTMVIPILNDVEDAIRTIVSVHQKSMKIIIVDGGSSTNDFSFKRFENLIYLHYAGSSIYEAMQEGVNIAKSEFVCFLGAGDLVVEIKYYDNIDINVGKYRIQSGPVRDGLMCNGYWRNPIHHQAAVYRKSRVFFDVNFKVLADFDLNVALIKNGASIIRVNSIFSNIKPHAVSNSFVAAISEGLKIYWKNSILLWAPSYVTVLIISRICRWLRWR